MKLHALILLMFIATIGSARADIPDTSKYPRPDGEIHSTDEPRSYGTIAAGIALAAALGIGGALAIRHLREQKEKPKGDGSAAPPVSAESK